MKLSTVILNYNGLKNTIECLNSIKNTNYKGINEIIVVDNDSTDGSKEYLSKIKDITFIKNNKNLGFSGGMNVGIKSALKNGSDFVLILNNDVRIDRLFFNKLTQKMSHKEIIAPKIYFEKGYEFHKKRYKVNELGKVIWYAGGEIDWNNILGVHIGVDEVDRGQFSKNRQVDFATGACMFVPKEIFKKIGFFDEKYFLYLEDMDFCLRAQKAGFKIMFNPGVAAWHKNAATSGGSGSKLQEYFISRNRLLFAFKFAKLKTKFAVLRQIISKLNKPIQRMVFVDFLFLNFGKGSFLK